MPVRAHLGQSAVDSSYLGPGAVTGSSPATSKRAAVRILLVEDSETHALLARHALKLYDPTIVVDHVESAEDALSTLQHETYDLILLDFYLPGKTGLECLRTLRAANNQTPVIMVTSQGQIKYAIDCIKAGANDYVAKDEGYAEMLPRSIEQVMTRHRVESENRELQRQLLRKNEELEIFNRRLLLYQRQIIQAEKMSALVTLVRGICHELNNPLTGILGYAQLMQELYKGHECLDDAREIEVCAKRCRDIISKLSSFCRQERIAVTACNLNEVVAESVSYVEYLGNRNRVLVDCSLAESMPGMQASAHDLRQLLLALFDNALKAMPAGGSLTVRTHFDDDSLEVQVADTGVGMTPEVQDQIFTPFYTTREVGEGTGLGLSMALGIVQEHGGTMQVDSAPNQGSRFTLRFRRKDADPEA